MHAPQLQVSSTAERAENEFSNENSRSKTNSPPTGFLSANGGPARSQPRLVASQFSTATRQPMQLSPSRLTTPMLLKIRMIARTRRAKAVERRVRVRRAGDAGRAAGKRRASAPAPASASASASLSASSSSSHSSAAAGQHRCSAAAGHLLLHLRPGYDYGYDLVRVGSGQGQG